MNIIFILFALIEVVVRSSTSRTIHLRVTRDGLLGEGLVIRNSRTRILSAYIFDTQRSTESHTVMSTNYSALGVRRWAMGPGSNFASQARSAMILPHNESSSPFRIVINTTDPTAHCYEGTIRVAEMSPNGHSVEFSASVSLIWNNQSSDPSIIGTTSGQPSLFELSTVSMFDVIPREVHDTLLAEIARLGVRTSEDENIDLLPDIEYTVYRSRESGIAVVRIISEPRDYLQLTLQGMRLMVQPESEWTGLQLGISTLKHIGVLIDYQNHQIGFCEPL